MDILAASYKNIGPFVDNLLTVRFGKGTYLIMAPIGTGKSFLFFDGPVFGLYKHADRPILNRAAEKGHVQVIFEMADQVWLIERKITPTRQGGESVRSRLFTSSKSRKAREEQLDQLCSDQSVVHDLDLLQATKQQREEISFANQREIDQAVQDLLPAKEAVLSINFLLQDAPNVFELTPAERVKIFKHLFGLLGIDEAKEVLAEKKRELKTTIKVKKESSQLEKKLHQRIDSLKNLLGELQKLAQKSDRIKSYLTRLQKNAFLEDILLLEGEIHIDRLQVDAFDEDIVEAFEKEYEQVQTKQNKLEGGIEQIKQQLHQLAAQKEELQKTIKQQQQTIKKREGKLKDAGDDKQTKLRKEKAALMEKLEQLTADIDERKLLDVGVEATTLEDLVDTQKEYDKKHSLLASERKHLREQYRSLDKQYNDLQKELEEKKKQLDELTKQFEEKEEFYCKLIEDTCPFLEKIKDTSQRMQALEKQRATLAKQVETIEQKKLPDLNEQREDKKKQGKELTHKITAVEKVLSLFDELHIAKKYAKQKEYKQQLEKIDRQLTELEQSGSDQQRIKEKLVSEKSQLEAKQEQLEKIAKEHKELTAARKKQAASLDTKEIARCKQASDHMQQIAQQYKQIEELVEERQENKLTIKQLEQKEKQVKELYKIFSKELLFVVLKKFLPHLEEVINTYLSQLVDYSIHFYLPSSADEKMELTIEIHDEKGVRSVDSLSGGQMMILKLVWILAVGRLMQANFLFLDETINNLDTEAIGRVARLLENYVSGQAMKFYVVTHSTQIQALDIWDEKIDVTQWVEKGRSK